MADLAKARITAQLEQGGATFLDPVAAATMIWAGAMLALDAAGNLIPAAPGSPTIRGVAVETADNSTGAAGDVSITSKRGAFLFNNSDLDRTDIGADCFVSDDNTVASTGTLVAGKLLQIEDAGAWVEIK